MSEPILYEGRFFLEFSIGGEIESLMEMFAALKADKDEYWKDESEGDEAAVNSASDPKWLDYLNGAAWNYFVENKDAEEEKVFWELWKLTKPSVRLTHPMFTRAQNWDFESMIEGIFHGEYTLDDIRQLDENRAVLLYDPWAGPFGGSEPLVALIESFGHHVTHDYWHQGPHKRGEIGWNYASARELVESGHGFEPQS